MEGPRAAGAGACGSCLPFVCSPSGYGTSAFWGITFSVLHLQCVQQTPLPGVEGWEHHTSRANHITHYTRSGPSEWYRPIMTTGTLDGIIGKGF